MFIVIKTESVARRISNRYLSKLQTLKASDQLGIKIKKRYRVRLRFVIHEVNEREHGADTLNKDILHIYH